MAFRFLTFAVVCCVVPATLMADWRVDIGFTRLQQLAYSELPVAPSQGLTQSEAWEDVNLTNYAPDTASALFSGKTFTLKSGASGISSHANSVATNFYGNASLIPGATPVDLYQADSWINAGFLKIDTTSVPLTEARAVQNHSWIGELSTVAFDTEASLRLDYAIDRDGFVCAVGENNGTSTILPRLMGQGYHTISVGLTNGNHSAGFTTLDVAERIKPDIVAPDGLTSYATPMVAGTAGLLVARLEAAPYHLARADMPRVVKALLLASATKDTVASWSNTSSRPLDLRYGAGSLNAWNAYSILRSGNVTASNITQRGPCAWAAEEVGPSTTQTYFFNIPVGAPTTPFCAALTWHRNVTTQKSGQTRTWSASLANLNLRLYQANGFTLGTVLSESLSAVDNVELIYQPVLAPGDYALVVDNTSGTNTRYGFAWHSLPAVTVQAVNPIAREIDGQAGSIMITRTGDTTLQLYVPLSIGGTATPVTHYQALPSSVTIPPGLTTVTLQITPVSDQLAQGDRSVIVSIAADFALVRDPSQTGVVTIHDKPFDAWRFSNFTSDELTHSTISGETADPDADTLANLIEYALGLPPKSANSTPVVPIDLDGYLALAAYKSAAATDITWGAEISPDLTEWNPAVITLNNASTFEARDNVLRNAATQRFIRLKITRP